MATLRTVIDRHLAPEINGVHVLPFHPASSDRGFSVVDYGAVDPAFGTWDDVAALASGRRFMADAVLNHMSAESDWFQAFLAGEPPYDRFFRTVDPGADLSRVVRPRTLPLVTTFGGADGPLHVWTTFSADQVDLDYRNPDVLLAALDILLRYCVGGRHRDPARCDRLLVEGRGVALDQPAGDARPDRAAAVVARRGRRRFDDRHRDQRAARRERRLSRAAGSPRGAGGLPVRLAAVDPAHRRDRRSGRSSWRGLRVSTSRPPGCTYLNFTSSHDGVGVRPVEEILLGDAVRR